MEIVEDVRAMVEAPFVGSLDLTQIFLLTGIVLVFILAWILILAHVRAAAETI